MYSHDVSAGFISEIHAQDRVSTRLAFLLIGCLSLMLWTGIAELASRLG